MNDRELGRALAAAGLSERAVFACFGVAAVAHAPRGRRFDERPPLAAIAPWLFVGGGAVDAALAARALPVDALCAAGLLARDGALVRAPLAIVPAGAALAVSDRFDATADDAVLPPDDSSHHLVSALPRQRVARWLDLACGNGWAPLAAAGRASHVVAADVAPRAIELARRGAALSGVALELRVADLADGLDGRFDLVSCNAPIPAERGDAGPRHRVSPRGDALLARLWAVLPSLLAPGGEAIVHSAIPDAADDHPAAALPGALCIARYTPAGVPSFAVTRWRPDAPVGRRVVEIALTSAAPHVPRDALE